MLELRVLLLLLIANGAPVFARFLMGDRGGLPIDFGVCFKDGRPLLGPAKTWRGLIAAVLICALVAPLLGFSIMTGCAVALLAMLGDLITSFCKRRINLTPSSRAPFLDQFLETVLPLAAYQQTLGLSLLQIGVIFVAFVVVNWGISPLLFRLGVRKKPY
ncbi:CDP-archaeol synthase [Hahella sp. KA22]|uniref:CDP-archaeol synthase n=1 Tax=Hahella sp. KA22 TaxID=1628392 RepID=UPI0019D4AE7B|nr:CDP-archaeol synthase [Hahella sp. KA22]